MGLTNSRRWWRGEETSAVHPSSDNNIDELKKETIDEVCFEYILDYNSQERTIGICLLLFFTHRIHMHMIGFISALFNLARFASLQLCIHSFFFCFF